MAQLSLNFRGKPLRVYSVEQDEVTIGRASDNFIRIDSLAIAEHHAIIHLSPIGSTIEPCTKQLQLWVNGAKIRGAAPLRHGDNVEIGKHSLYFTEGLVLAAPRGPRIGDADRLALEPPPCTSLQVMSGKQVGRIIPLQRTLTRLWRANRQVAALLLEDDGFVLCSLDEVPRLEVNGEPILLRSAPLKNGDILRIDSDSLQFIQPKFRGVPSDGF